MKYLIVDGMLPGTGIRDSVEGVYLAPEALGLLFELRSKLSNWLSRYEDEHYAQYEDRTVVADLDSEGMEICKLLKLEMPDIKVEYFSTAEMKRCLVE